ncbi:glycosyltransferase 87 family protein [Rugosimonospora acidiphila]|uniref:Glycosyltransferase 87 family protein n=1 Tax=Rugosimonospora acidiphila TaxID=556531 RepID=A0ABP9STK7_9ACTN
MNRLAAGAGLFVVSVAGWVALVATGPGVYWRQSDALVYRAAGSAVLHGSGALYAQAFGAARLPFTYPPFAALLFAAGSPLSFPVWQLILAVAGLCCLVLSAYAAVRLATPTTGGPGGATRTGRLGWALAVAAVGLWLEPVDLTLHFGQINLILLALVLVDFAAPDTARGKGIAIGIAAGLKLTPLIFIPYLLLTGRIRAAAASVAAFAGTVAIGFALLGRDSVDYWGGRFSQPGDSPVRLVNQSLNGLVLRLLRDGPDAHAVWIVAALAVGVAGLVTAVVAGRRGYELLGVCLCAATGLLVSPISWSHHWVYVVPALALATAPLGRLRGAAPLGRLRGTAPLGSAGSSWRLRSIVSRGRVRGAAGGIVAVAALVALFAWWPLRVAAHGGTDPAIGIHPSGLLRVAPHDSGAELRWTAWQLAYGDGYVIAALAFVLGSAAWLAVNARLGVIARQSRPTAGLASDPGAVGAGARATGA